ncbi:hypothetical protein FRAHR75_130073 [Frankia sp. Hr75.2]|nr:hypothetical protein FRAHR75_130073 [Frankia sp. Hr75.2]
MEPADTPRAAAPSTTAQKGVEVAWPARAVACLVPPDGPAGLAGLSGVGVNLVVVRLAGFRAR